MKIKKIFSLLLIFAILLSLLTACGSNEEDPTDFQETTETTAQGSSIANDNKLLPYNLTFGMSHNDAKATCDGFPAISDATANDGYFSDSLYPDIEDYYDMFGIDGDTLYDEMINGDALVRDPAYYFSFNEDKQLYEFYVITGITDGESTAEYLFNTYADHLTEHLGQPINTRENYTGMEITFETDTIGASVTMEVDGASCTVSLIVHNKVFELDS